MNRDYLHTSELGYEMSMWEHLQLKEVGPMHVCRLHNLYIGTY